MAVKNIATPEINTLEYDVKNSESNVFEISMPQLTYGFVSYKRLNDDYAKIIDQNTIMWDGKEFIKNK